MQEEPVIPTPEVEQKKPKNKKLLLIAAVAALFIGGSAAAFTVMQNDSPEAIWQKALDTTSEKFESFVTSEQADNYKGGKVDGSFKLSAPTVADGTISGEWYESNVSLSGEVGVSGIRANGDVRAIAPESGAVPDVYLKVSGLEGVGALFGQQNDDLGGIIEEVNDQWYQIDRTLIEQGLSETGDSSSLELSDEDIAQIGTATAAVLDERLFTSDTDKAVVIVDEYLGEEEFDGEDTYKYRVRVQKQQLKDFATVMKDALGETKFKDVVMSSAEDGESYEEALDFEKLLEDIEEQNFDNATAEAWVDAKRKFIRNVRIASPEAEGQYIDFGLDYENGDELPFYIRAVSTEAGNEGTLNLGLTYNESASKIDLSFDVDITDDGQKIDAEGTLAITLTDEQIAVEAPNDAKNILELIGPFLGGSSVMEPSSEAVRFDDIEL